MSVNTKNSHGKITITDDAIAKVASHVAMECYGVVEIVSRKLSDSISQIFRKNDGTHGVNVTTLGDRIFIDLFVILKYGVSITAVAESLKESVKYRVENFTGMIVDTVNVNIVGIKL